MPRPVSSVPAPGPVSTPAPAPSAPDTPALPGTPALLVKGLLVGAGALTPGVSGGAMALAAGVYTPLVEALANPRRWRRHLRALWPLGLGMALGALAFVLVLQLLLARWPLPTLLGFCGLILGGVPSLWRRFAHSLARTPGQRPVDVRPCLGLFVLLFAAGAALAFWQPTGGAGGSLPSAPVLLAAGVPFAATLLVPGLSGSALLMVLGLYAPMLAAAARLPGLLLAGNLTAALWGGLPLFAFGVGLAVGLLLLARLVRFLFARHAPQALAGALGLLLSAPVAVLRQAVLLGKFSLGGVLAGAAALVAGFWLAARLSGRGGADPLN